MEKDNLEMLLEDIRQSSNSFSRGTTLCGPSCTSSAKSRTKNTNKPLIYSKE